MQHQVQYQTYCNFILPDLPDSGQIFQESYLSAYYTYCAPVGKSLVGARLVLNWGPVWATLAIILGLTIGAKLKPGSGLVGNWLVHTW